MRFGGNRGLTARVKQGSMEQVRARPGYERVEVRAASKGAIGQAWGKGEDWDDSGVRVGVTARVMLGYGWASDKLKTHLCGSSIGSTRRILFLFGCTGSSTCSGSRAWGRARARGGARGSCSSPCRGACRGLRLRAFH